MARLTAEEYTARHGYAKPRTAVRVATRRQYGLEIAEVYTNSGRLPQKTIALVQCNQYWVMFTGGVDSDSGTVYEVRAIALQHIADILGESIYTDGMYYTETNWD